jgi:hypothetical protein
MESSNILLITLPITILFGIAFWLMIFLSTYKQFPRMNPEERLWLCITNATILTAILVGIVYLALWLILQNFIQ